MQGLCDFRSGLFDESEITLRDGSLSVCFEQIETRRTKPLITAMYMSLRRGCYLVSKYLLLIRTRLSACVILKL